MSKTHCSDVYHIATGSNVTRFLLMWIFMIMQCVSVGANEINNEINIVRDKKSFPIRNK